MAGTGTGVIAIGMAVTSRSITRTILIVTTISTATSVAKAATFSTIHNTGAMRLTETGKQRTSLVVRVRVELVALVVPAVRVGLVVPEDPVEPAVQESPAVPELEPAQVAVELEHVPVVVVLVRGHPRAQLAVVALRTKSATAAHPHDLVPLLEVGEDLAAAVAETTREPAAAEAVIAWAAEE